MKMQTLHPKASSPDPRNGWGLQAPAITKANLSAHHPPSPDHLLLSLPQVSPRFYLAAQPRRPLRWLVLSAVVGLRPAVPTDWEEDVGGGTQRLRTPGLPHTCPPPPRPLDLPTDQMQPPGPPASTTQKTKKFCKIFLKIKHFFCRAIKKNTVDTDVTKFEAWMDGYMDNWAPDKLDPRTIWYMDNLLSVVPNCQSLRYGVKLSQRKIIQMPICPLSHSLPNYLLIKKVVENCPCPKFSVVPKCPNTKLSLCQKVLPFPPCQLCKIHATSIQIRANLAERTHILCCRISEF